MITYVEEPEDEHVAEVMTDAKMRMIGKVERRCSQPDCDGTPTNAVRVHQCEEAQGAQANAGDLSIEPGRIFRRPIVRAMAASIACGERGGHNEPANCASGETPFVGECVSSKRSAYDTSHVSALSSSLSLFLFSVGLGIWPTRFCVQDRASDFRSRGLGCGAACACVHVATWLKFAKRCD